MASKRHDVGTESVPKKDKTLICIPAMSQMPTAFVISLVKLLNKKRTAVTVVTNSLVYDARNEMAQRAIDLGYDRVLWIDSDMTFDDDIIERLGKHLDEGKEYVTALAFNRSKPMRPCIWTAKEQQLVIYYDYPEDSLFEVAASGLAACMMTTDVLKRVMDAYGNPFTPVNGNGEDISFCFRAMSLGVDLWCDSSVKVGHLGYVEFDESVYKGLRDAE